VVTFLNTRASDPIAAHPRAVYRVTVARAGAAAPLYLAGVVKFRNAVEQTIDQSHSAAGFALGGNLDSVQNGDSVAVLDYRAASMPRASTVGDLARAIDAASAFTTVVSVERKSPVPAESAGGGRALAADRDAAQDTAQTQADAESIAARIRSAFSGAATVAAIAAVLVLAGAAWYLLPRKGGAD